MSNTFQLKLFSPTEPEWENITLEWLFEYLNSYYPELKFIIDKDYDGRVIGIEQSVCKKVRLQFYIARYDKCVPGRAGKKFIGGSSERYFGPYCGQTFGFDSMEELKEMLPRRIEIFWQNIEDFKNYKKIKKVRIEC